MHRIKLVPVTVDADELSDFLDNAEHTVAIIGRVRIPRRAYRMKIACVEGNPVQGHDVLEEKTVSEYVKTVYVQAGRDAKLILTLRPEYVVDKPEVECGDEHEYIELEIEDKLVYNVSPVLVITFDIGSTPDIDNSVIKRFAELIGKYATETIYELIANELIRPM